MATAPSAAWSTWSRKKPSFTPIHAARAATGSDGLARLAVDLGGPIGDAVAYRLNVSGNRDGGWTSPNGDFRNLAVSGALLFQLNPDLAVTLSHDLGYQEPARYWGTPLVNGRIVQSLRNNNYNVDGAKIVWADNWTQLKTEWTPSADITIRNTAYRLQSRRHWLDVEQYRFNSGTGRIDRSDYLEIYHNQEQVGNRFDAAFKGNLFGFRNEFAIGFDVNHVDFRHTNNFSQRRRRPRHQRRSVHLRSGPVPGQWPRQPGLCHQHQPGLGLRREPADPQRPTLLPYRRAFRRADPPPA